MALRRFCAGDITIEQTRDLAAVRAILSSAAMMSDGIEWPQAIYLGAQIDSQPGCAGIAGLEPRIDSAILRSVWVRESSRGRGVGRALVAAARAAARARGVRHLYAFSTAAGDFFAKLGFVQVPIERTLAAIAGAPQTEYYRAHPDELAREVTYYLDISRDGVIDR
jgi:amino-acid N-acetyltransferase